MLAAKIFTDKRLQLGDSCHRSCIAFASLSVYFSVCFVLFPNQAFSGSHALSPQSFGNARLVGVTVLILSLIKPNVFQLTIQTINKII